MNIEDKVNYILENFKKNIKDNFSNAEFDLYSIEKLVADNFLRCDSESLTKIRNKIEMGIFNEEVDLNFNFLLGKAHSILEIINYFLLPNQLDEKVKFTERKNIREILLFIKEKGYTTPSILIKKFKLKKSHVGNILRSIRTEDLIDVDIIGKNRYYTLTPLGEKLCEKIISNLPKQISKLRSITTEMIIELPIKEQIYIIETKIDNQNKQVKEYQIDELYKWEMGETFGKSEFPIYN